MAPIAKVGYVGVGTMGGPIAVNVVKGGYDLMVFDLDDAAMRPFEALDARIGHSAREVGEFADLIELSVTDDAAVERAVLGPDGVLEGAKPGSIIAVHSTVHPRTVKKVAAAANPKGVAVLDAAPSGGAAGAQAHRLLWMVGGEAADFERCRPVFETSGNAVYHLGPLGSGSAAKCAQQMITTVNMLAAYEGFQVAKAVGLNLEEFNKALHDSTGQSYMADQWLERFSHGMNARSREGFYKGLIPCLTLANEVGVFAPGTALIQQIFPQLKEPE